MLIGFELASSAQEGSMVVNEDGTSNYVGTPAYSAPEQFEYPEIVGPPADVFALGVVLYEALTGFIPLPYGSDPGLYAVSKLPPPERMKLPESLYRLICKMLSQDAALRPNPARLHDELQMCLLELNDE